MSGLYITAIGLTICCRKYGDRPWEYINCSQTHECGNWDWGRAIPFLGIHKWVFRCSVEWNGGWACTPHPHQPRLIFSWWCNVRQKEAVATLCTLWVDQRDWGWAAVCIRLLRYADLKRLYRAKKYHLQQSTNDSEFLWREEGGVLRHIYSNGDRLLWSVRGEGEGVWWAFKIMVRHRRICQSRESGQGADTGHLSFHPHWS